MEHKLTAAEANHLRRLLGWAACEAGQEPEEMVGMVRKLAPAIGPDLSDEGKARMVQAHQQASKVPKYVWAAIKALRKTLEPNLGEVVDAEAVEERQLPAPDEPSNPATRGGRGQIT